MSNNLFYLKFKFFYGYHFIYIVGFFTKSIIKNYIINKQDQTMIGLQNGMKKEIQNQKKTLNLKFKMYCMNWTN